MSGFKDPTNNKDIKIALTLSGGGYRASVFHIGVLSYLYHLKMDDGTRLLDHITVMSTISGGTITGMNYLLNQSQGASLNENLSTLFQQLKDNNLAESVLENIDKKRNHKTLSVIKELGNVYNEMFFKNATFKSIYEAVNKSHIHYYAAYATDIENAEPFRFQAINNNTADGVIGNSHRAVSYDKSSQIRVADVVAASSCFPIAFEPINYPRDFFSFEVRDERAQTNMQTPLMDGGILDNQGIDYLFEANRRMVGSGNDALLGIDLAIISDASSSFSETKPNIENRSALCLLFAKIKRILYFCTFVFVLIWLLRLLRYSTVRIIELLLSILAILSGVCWFCLGNGPYHHVYISICVTSVILLFIIFVGMSYIPKELKKSNQYKIPNNLIWNIKFIQYYRLVNKRVDSFKKVVSNVMMGQIRNSNLQTISENSRWTNRFLVPCISTLTSNGAWKNDQKMRELMANSKEVMACSDIAANFHTTLWFSQEDIANKIPEKILACGQYTACFELYRWVLTHKGKLANLAVVHGKLRSKQIKKQLRNDWNKFKEDPYRMTELLNLN